jgi:hypothetical protein
MAPPKITFYVDIVSPFAYIAFYLLRVHETYSPLNLTNSMFRIPQSSKTRKSDTFPSSLVVS